jgi:hypothetical protein
MHFDRLRNRETLFLSLFIFLLIKSKMLTEKIGLDIFLKYKFKYLLIYVIIVYIYFIN